jgi:septum formation inhibitor MinC
MNQEFIDNVYYTPTEEECCYESPRALPIPDTPNFVIAFAFGMFLIFCNEMISMTCGQGYNILTYLEKKTASYIKENLDFYFYNDNVITEEDNEGKEQTEEVPTDYVPKKYEDKYLEEFQKLTDEIVLTEEEISKEIEQRPASRVDLEKKLESEKDELKKKMEILESQMKDIDTNMMGDAENAPRKSEIVSSLNRALKRLNEEMEKLNEKIITEEDVNNASKEFVINERYNCLKNNIIMEKTPLGNVVMFYNNSRSSFEYYSDSTIPYRYLEVLGRKYVLTYNCKQIYVDMSKELEEAEKKLAEKKQKEEDEKQKQEEAAEKAKSNPESEAPEPQKKNVFAKFKTYNKDTSIKAAAVPLDRPAPAKNTKPQEEKVVKERANRYSYEGKLVNFSFLKKVDRKEVDKRYGVSFAEFKKMQQKK